MKKRLLVMVATSIAVVLAVTLLFTNAEKKTSSPKRDVKAEVSVQKTDIQKTIIQKTEDESIASVYKKEYKLKRNDVDEIKSEEKDSDEFEKSEKLSKPSAFEEDEGKDKFDEPAKFTQFENDIRTHIGSLKPDYPKNYKMIELNKAVERKFGVGLSSYNAAFKEMQAATIPWKERGPGNVAGRTRGMIVDPDDATHNTWFAGSVGGGIWKTTDGGVTWTDKTPGLPNLATSVLEMAQSNHDIIYAGTGEGFYNTDAINGDGIFKSTDHGETWNQLTSTKSNLDFQNVNRIIVDPSDANVVYTCANVGFYSVNLGYTSGIFKSTDGGSTWTKIYGSNSRIQQLLSSPATFNTMYATVNGLGVIKSTDAGLTWDTTQGIVTSGRVEIAIAPTDNNRMYAGAESTSGSDLFISDDAGDNWQLVNDQSGTNPNWLNGQGWYNNTLVVSPSNKDSLFVGGVNVYKIAMAPGTDTSHVLTASTTNTNSFLGYINWGGGLLYGSADVGANFLGSSNVTDTDYVSVEVRFGPGMSQKAHRFVNSGGNYLYQDYVTVPFEVWDITHNRQLMVSFRDWANDGAFDLISYNSANVQREYLFISSVPYDASTPSPIISTTNGMAYKNIYSMWPILATGGTWDANNLPTSKISFLYNTIIAKLRKSTQITNWYSGAGYPYIHADQHSLITIPGSGTFRILAGNDGGAAISNDGGQNWTQITSYQTTQFYGVDKNPSADQYLGGMQDNGTWYSDVNPGPDSSYYNALGGDGFGVVWKYDDPNQMLGSIYYNRVYKSTNGGMSWDPAQTGLSDANVSSKSPFITRIAKSTQDPDLLFVTSSSGVWRSDNFAKSWTLSPAAISGGSSFANSEISKADPQIVWAGAYMTTSGEKINVSTDGGLTFNPTNSYANLGRITGLASSPVDDSTAYVLLSASQAPKILRTTDLGQSWTDLSGFGSNTSSSNGFPDVAVYCLLQMPTTPDTIWAGTEIGLFQSTDNGATWALASNGLPNVAIWQMRIVGHQIVIATHGRGIWSVDAPWLSGYTVPAVTKSPRLDPLAQAPEGDLSVPISLRSPYDSTMIYINGSMAAKIEMNTSVIDTVYKVPVTVAGTDTVQVIAMKDGRQYKSATQIQVVKVLQTAQNTYVNDFNTASSDFSGNGFSITQPTGFKSGAINSAHPYSDNTNNIYQLLIPINVAASNATLEYDDVALVEPGDPGTKFGDSNFWDYVIVEATSDGINWKQLLDGYDAGYDATWLSTFNSNGNGDSTMFKHHTLDLLSKFNAGDKILVRFRLFADAGTHGWGWAIDNLSIQPTVVPVELTSFMANSVENKINLTWQTATEKNNSGFEIQRSQDKVNFVKIGFMKGNGSSTEKHSYGFSDEKAPMGKNYYRLKQIDLDGTSSYSKVIEAVQMLPTEFSLSQNYPNPFNPSTVIKFQLPVKEQVTLTVFNSLGEKIKTLVDGVNEAGYYKINWDGRNEYNNTVATGVYLYRIQAGNFVDTKKMILMK